MGTRIVILLVALVVLALIAGGAVSQTYQEEYQQSERVFLRGDVNGDSLICIDDPVFLIYHLFRDGRELPCIAAADFDGSRHIDINDIVYGLNFLFVGDVYLTGSIAESCCYSLD